MDAFFQWLSSNTLATTILIVAFGVVVVIYAIAFAQGREISFWPPKIGIKDSKPKKGQKSRKTGRYLKFEWAKGIDRDLIPSRLANASTIDWMAVSMTKTLEIYDEEIAACLKNGGQIRILLINPDSKVPNTLARLGNKYKNVQTITSEIKNDINRTLSNVAKLHKMIPNCKLEVRYIIGQPPYRLMIINRALDIGYIRLRWVVTADAYDVPTVTLSKNEDTELVDFFDFIVSQFEEYWEMAQVAKIDDLLKNNQTD